jgi:hypothetical protein
LERTVDFAAISRVAKTADLTDVRLLSINAKCNPANASSLRSKIDLDCKPGDYSPNKLEVFCEYSFVGLSGEARIIEATISYALTYTLAGSEEPSESDLVEFARANGALHSWPFVRAALHGLTSKMGYPSYILPTLHFRAKSDPEAKPEGETDPSEVDGAENGPVK